MPTGIEWTDETWNPVTGCTQVSPGCANCYIARTPPFRKDGRRFRYEGKGLGVTTGVRLHEDRLAQPLRWKRPRRIFVNSLSDLFHPDVPDEFICRVFETMRDAPQHVFQVLTKRPERMKEWIRAWRWRRLPCCSPGYPRDPLPNVWLGVSAENQHWADQRIPHLLETPAAVRFVSCEPLLGPVDLRRWLPKYAPCDGYCPCDSYFQVVPGEPCVGNAGDVRGIGCLDWVISGGESGPNARPSHPDWFRQLRDQCAEAGVAYFHKQWGRWAPLVANGPLGTSDRWVGFDGRVRIGDPEDMDYDAAMRPVGKKLAGALLDGREHREFPEVMHD